jgi:hypothetical protein
MFNKSNLGDVTGDGITNLEDLIYTIARIGLSIHYFDFYSKDGVKLNIGIRSVNDPKEVIYSGTEDSVLVVPKDINKASGLTSKLSDIDSVWYKSTGWTFESAEEVDSLSYTRSKTQALESILPIVVDHGIVNVNPYLTGWHLDVRYIETGSFAELDSVGLLNNDFTLYKYRDQIKASHFSATNMNYENEVLLKTQYTFHIGSVTDNVLVLADRRTVKHTYSHPTKGSIYIFKILSASSIIFISDADKVLEGKITSDDTKMNGEISLKRIGPKPLEETFTTTVTDGKFEVTDIPFGEYTASLDGECGCKIPLTGNVVFSSDGVVDA